MIFGGIFDLENTNKSFKIKDKMKQLFLLRHGEAGFSEESDFDRSLTEKGIESLHRMGQVLQERSLAIDLAYCSPARRTQETSTVLQKHVVIKEHIFVQEIYDADLNFLLDLLSKIPFSVNSCILIGHNPTISSLMAHLTQENFIRLEPGMFAEISLSIDNWDVLGFGTGTLEEIVS